MPNPKSWKPLNPATLELRKELGLWLKQKREDAGLNQRDLANLLDLDFYTFISQLETGRGRIPSGRYEAWANAARARPARVSNYNIMLSIST